MSAFDVRNSPKPILLTRPVVKFEKVSNPEPTPPMPRRGATESDRAAAQAQMVALGRLAASEADHRVNGLAARIERHVAYVDGNKATWSPNMASALADALGEIDRDVRALPDPARDRFLGCPAERQLADLRDTPGVTEFVWARNLVRAVRDNADPGLVREMSDRLTARLNILPPAFAAAIRHEYGLVGALEALAEPLVAK